jgi:hypothetical protein
MPTHEELASFWRDWQGLTPGQQRRFRDAAATFVQDLQAGHGFRPGLRAKGVQGAEGIYELTWAQNGRATFQYGQPIVETEPHIIWRRIGTHDVLERP